MKPFGFERQHAFPVDWQAVVVDIGRSSCDGTALGEPPKPGDFIFSALSRSGMLESEKQGLELGSHEDRLDSIVVDVRRFSGRFELDGRWIDLGPQTTEQAIRSWLGGPWWRDEDEDEVLLFYEDGCVERQFELTKEGTLTLITLTLRPLLADAEQRRAYGVTKAWPPAD